MNIGKLELKNNVFLAPMAGVTDLPFRLICHELDCGLVFSEMVSAKGIIYKNEATCNMLTVSEAERPAALQLFGSEPDVMSEAVKRIEHVNADVIDINMGCPAPKIVKNGDGSALMTNPSLVYRIVKAVTGVTEKPVSVKIRKGFDDKSVNAVEVAKAIEEGGAAFVTVHGRTREQYYSGKADWSIISEVKQRVGIPVIGNGDVCSPEDALNMLNETGCDGVMIGRGAHGNPWIFKQTIYFLKTGELLPNPSLEEKIAMAIRHGKMLVEYKGEYTAVREMRRHMAMYIKGYKGAARLREVINKAESLEEMIRLFDLSIY